jgi:hypothetical protein
VANFAKTFAVAGRQEYTGFVILNKFIFNGTSEFAIEKTASSFAISVVKGSKFALPEF